MSLSADSEPASTPSVPPPRRAPPRPHAPRLRPRRPDRRVLGEPQDARLRRAADRLRGGPDAPGGARRDAAGAPAVTARTPLPTGRRIGEYLMREMRRQPWLFSNDTWDCA